MLAPAPKIKTVGFLIIPNLNEYLIQKYVYSSHNKSIFSFLSISDCRSSTCNMCRLLIEDGRVLTVSKKGDRNFEFSSSIQCSDSLCSHCCLFPPENV